MSNSNNKSRRVAVLALFTAVTVVLQVLSYFVKIGMFNLSLVLVPIVLSGILYGASVSAYLGAVFGIITVIGCVSGIDAGGAILFQASPLLTVLICLLKGTLAGFVSGLIARLFSKKAPALSTFLAAAAAPVVNTAVFIAMTLLFFKDILYTWAAGTNLVTYVITGLVGVNFLFELALNLILAPTLLRVSKILKKQLKI